MSTRVLRDYRKASNPVHNVGKIKRMYKYVDIYLFTQMHEND